MMIFSFHVSLCIMELSRTRWLCDEIRRFWDFCGAQVNGHFEIALSVADFGAVDAAYNRVVEQGAIPIMPPVTEPWGQRTCYVSDPEGNLVEIGSFVRKSQGEQDGLRGI